MNEAPIVQQRPLHQRSPASTAQTSAPRRTAEQAAGTGGQMTGSSATGDVVRVDRSEAGATAAAQLGANAFTSGSTIVLPPSHGPMEGPRARSLLAHELVHVEQQRQYGSSLPPEDSPVGQALEREAGRAEHAAATVPNGTSPTSGPRGIPMPVARGRTRSDGSSARGARDATGPSQRQHDGGQDVSAASDLASPDMAPALFASQPPTSDTRDVLTLEAPAPQRAEMSSSPAAGGSASDDEGDAEVDELARKIYDRIQYRFRRELLLDRERSGLLVDVR
jgi:hypothetical protein